MKNLIISLESDDHFDAPDLYFKKLSLFWSKQLNKNRNSDKIYRFNEESEILVNLNCGKDTLLSIDKFNNRFFAFY